MRHFVLCFIFFTSLGSAADYYVSPRGSDSNNGKSVDSAWRSIDRAVKNLSPGDTAHLRGGIYSEAVAIRVSGTEGKPIRIQAYREEVPIMDGSKIEVKDQTAMIDLEDVSHVIIQGLEIRNLKSDAKKCVPIGILVTGASHHIEIRNNRVHSIETNFPEKNGGDAHGIAVFGNREQSIHHLVVDGNTLSNLKLGSSEALVLNGNVSEFAVTNNSVHDCNNIGIDLIGFEKIGPSPEVDQARNGICAGNEVYNIDSFGNPAYGNSRSAGGIYVDGGTNIIVERNRVWNCNIGIELASEHKDGSTSRISLRNNLIFKNHIGGIFIGGYNKKRGLTENCAIYNNTLYQNDDLQDGNGELYLQFGTKNNIIRNNIFVSNDQDLFIGNPYEENEGNDIDYNLYFCEDGPDSAEFQWKKKRSKNWNAWLEADGMDRHSVFADPKFVNPEANDFKLSSDSPCRDAGDPKYKPGNGESDLAGRPRVAGKAVDLGTFETP